MRSWVRNIFGSNKGKSPDEIRALLLANWITAGDKEVAISIIMSVFDSNNNKRLELQNLGLTSIPAEFKYLPAYVEELDLSNNEIAVVEHLESVTSLITLNLSHNKIKNFPYSLLSSAVLKYLNVENNNIGQINTDLLARKSAENGIVIECAHNALTEADALAVVIPEDIFSRIFSEQNQITLEPGELEELQYFLRTVGMLDFRRFLIQCKESRSWQYGGDVRQNLCDGLFDLIKDINRDSDLKDIVIAIASTNISEIESEGRWVCGDRSAITFLYMQMARNVPTKPLNKMKYRELVQYAKTEVYKKFLIDKADGIIKDRESKGNPVDPIEVYMVYLRLSKDPDLAIDLGSLKMRYKHCAHVSESTLDADLDEAKSRKNELIYTYLRDDPYMQACPQIRGLKLRDISLAVQGLEKIGRIEIDTLPKSKEKDASYQQRLRKITKAIWDETAKRVNQKMRDVENRRVALDLEVAESRDSRPSELKQSALEVGSALDQDQKKTSAQREYKPVASDINHNLPVFYETTDLYQYENDNIAQSRIRIERNNDKIWASDEIENEITQNLTEAFSCIESQLQDWNKEQKKAFVRSVIEFAQDNQGVGTVGLESWKQYMTDKFSYRDVELLSEQLEREFNVAKEFSFYYQAISKREGFLTGRQDGDDGKNLNKTEVIGARLKRIPVEMTDVLLDKVFGSEQGQLR